MTENQLAEIEARATRALECGYPVFSDGLEQGIIKLCAALREARRERDEALSDVNAAKDLMEHFYHTHRLLRHLPFAPRLKTVLKSVEGLRRTSGFLSPEERKFYRNQFDNLTGRLTKLCLYYEAGKARRHHLNSLVQQGRSRIAELERERDEFSQSYKALIRLLSKHEPEALGRLPGAFCKVCGLWVADDEYPAHREREAAGGRTSDGLPVNAGLRGICTAPACTLRDGASVADWETE
jgi:chromosome segregation ATPase